MSIVTPPELEIIGDGHVYHEKDFPYVDLGAKAKSNLTDGTQVDVAVKTVTNSVPSPCITLGNYEVQYEATGPYGLTSRCTRRVTVGSFASKCAYV